MGTALLSTTDAACRCGSDGGDGVLRSRRRKRLTARAQDEAYYVSSSSSSLLRLFRTSYSLSLEGGQGGGGDSSEGHSSSAGAGRQGRRTAVARHRGSPASASASPASSTSITTTGSGQSNRASSSHQARMTTTSFRAVPHGSAPSTPVQQQKRHVTDDRRAFGARCSIVKTAWPLHFASSLILLAFLALLGNRYERKYVPIGPSSVLPHCHRGFINVMATSPDELDAVVCCEDSSSGDTIASSLDKVPSSSSSSSSFMDLCPNRSLEYRWLPLSSRLSRFPDAWLIPLSPLLLRILYLVVMYIQRKLMEYLHKLQSGGAYRRLGWRPAAAEINRQFVPILLRLGLYVLVFNFRGWVLYVLFNQVEDSIVTIPHHDTCSWYKAYLREDQRHECVGRIFDFSDHMVLYYAQLLPIAFLETLYAFVNPYWGNTTTLRTVNDPQATTESEGGSPSAASGLPSAMVMMTASHDHASDELGGDDDSSSYSEPRRPRGTSKRGNRLVDSFMLALRWCADRSIPFLLIAGLLYLYLITYLGVYKTAYYFHTVDEVLLGYIVSLAVQVPMALLLLPTPAVSSDDGQRNRRGQCPPCRYPKENRGPKLTFDDSSGLPTTSNRHAIILGRVRSLLFPLAD